MPGFFFFAARTFGGASFARGSGRKSSRRGSRCGKGGTITAGGGRGKDGVPMASPGVPLYMGIGRAVGSAGIPFGDGT